LRRLQAGEAATGHLKEIHAVVLRLDSDTAATEPVMRPNAGIAPEPSQRPVARCGRSRTGGVESPIRRAAGPGRVGAGPPLDQSSICQMSATMCINSVALTASVRLGMQVATGVCRTRYPLHSGTPDADVELQIRSGIPANPANRANQSSDAASALARLAALARTPPWVRNPSGSNGIQPHDSLFPADPLLRLPE